MIKSMFGSDLECDISDFNPFKITPKHALNTRISNFGFELINESHETVCKKRKKNVVAVSCRESKSLDNSLECISTFQRSIHKSNASFWKENKDHSEIYTSTTFSRFKENLEKYA